MKAIQVFEQRPSALLIQRTLRTLSLYSFLDSRISAAKSGNERFKLTPYPPRIPDAWGVKDVVRFINLSLSPGVLHRDRREDGKAHFFPTCFHRPHEVN